MHLYITALATCLPVALGLCPMAELSRQGLAPRDLEEAYKEKRAPDMADPLSDVLAPLGLDSLVPRSPRSVEHERAIEQHLRARLEEREEDIDINAAVLTPKAHKRFVEKRGLLGGVLPPLTGVLAGVDVPTPQMSGLKAIPGDSHKHRYIPPGKTDIRGDCPTLNTLANHGYLNRNGITTFAEAANAIQIAFSMGFDTAVFLSALGLLAGGDIPTGIYSIGGASSLVPETLGEPLYGIDRHGLFEADASVSRNDRYYGDNHSFNITRWNKLVHDANVYGNGQFNIRAMKRNARDAIVDARNNNPEFNMGAAYGVIYATRALITRPLPNGTNPEFADFSNIAPFYLNETFPENWYRIPKAYPLIDLLRDIGDIRSFDRQPLGNNYNGRFIPNNLTVPTAPQDAGCFAAALLASGAPNEAIAVVEAANAVKDQIFKAVLGAAECNIDDYNTVSNSSYKVPHEQINGGSGSGITRLGEWDSESKKPRGKSAGEPT